MKRVAVVAVMVVAGSAAADKDQALARLEKAVPHGWSVLATENELVIRHDRPVYCVDHPDGPLVTLELRYRLEPKWTPEHYAEARATNDKVAAELAALRQRLGTGKAFDKEAAKVRAREVRLPVCTLDHSSIIERADTYAQLALDLDPAEVKTEGARIQELVDKHCPPP